MLAEFSSLQHCRQSRNAEADVRSDFQERGCCKIHWISEGFASPSSFREFNGESFLTH